MTGLLDGFRKPDIPLGVFHVGCSWMEVFKVYTEKHDYDILLSLVQPGAVIFINQQPQAAQDLNEERLELLANSPVLSIMTINLVDPD